MNEQFGVSAEARVMARAARTVTYREMSFWPNTT